MHAEGKHRAQQETAPECVTMHAVGRAKPTQPSTNTHIGHEPMPETALKTGHRAPFAKKPH